MDENNELDDLTLYALGLKTKEEMSALMKASANKEVVEYEDAKWSYKDVCGMELRTILPADCYNYDEAKGVYTDLRETDAGMKYLYDNGLTLRIVGIVKPDEEAVSANVSGSVGYTHMLTEYLSEHAEAADPVKAQKADPAVDIFTGLPFKGDGKMTDGEKAAFFRDHVASLDEREKAALYVRVQSSPDEEEVEAYVGPAMTAATRESMEAQMLRSLQEQTGMAAESVQDYLSAMIDEQIRDLYANSLQQVYRRQYAAGVMAKIGM
ncbi:MAG: ABC transporter, partial [Clostridia bacterium]|nr:ABC transporter [Clostridia bacterium]